MTGDGEDIEGCYIILLVYQDTSYYLEGFYRSEVWL